MKLENCSGLAATSQPSGKVLDRLENKSITNLSNLALTDIEYDLSSDVFIESGVYEVSYLYHETQIIFNTPKVIINFKIVQPGPYFGMKLFRAFRVNALIGKPGRGGRFKLKKRSELLLELYRLFQSQNIRPDRVSLKPLKGLTLRVKVRTVERDYKQRRLPDALRYSVVGDFLSVAAGVINI